jgi:hypothetical protein
LFTTLSTEMTGISLHLQWPLTSQLHYSFSQREQLEFDIILHKIPIFSIPFFSQERNKHTWKQWSHLVISVGDVFTRVAEPRGPFLTSPLAPRG